MNYLSHYYIDHQKGNYYFNAALFLPDFARNYVKHFTNTFTDFTEHEQNLLAGCLAHYQADKTFHPSAFFNQYNTAIVEEINQFVPLAHLPRKWFLGHILTEMLIDRLIVKQMPEICHQFYHDLAQIDTKILHVYVSRFSFKNADPFIKNFRHFCDARYLFGYALDESFVYSLTRVYAHTTKTDITLNDKMLVKQLVNFIEQKYFNEPMTILAALKTVFQTQ
ncbi:MAG: hypothetical protein V4643_06400 [Bacteroidota bacterium]